MAEVDTALNREYDQAEYERKIKKLVRPARKRTGKEYSEPGPKPFEGCAKRTTTYR